MATYQSVPTVQNESHGSNEGSPLVGEDRIPIVDRPPSRKRYFVGGVVALCFLAVGAYYRHYGANTTATTAQGLLSFIGADKAAGDRCVVTKIYETSCGADLICCPKSLTGTFGKCQSCCTHYDCLGLIEQPVAGDYGEPFCIDDTCQASKTGQAGQDILIEEGGYPVYMPSETIDNSKTFQKYAMPRKVISNDPNDPVFESLWYFDFNEQPDIFSMDDIVYNGTHITLKSFAKMHAGYSKYYKAFDERETGIVTMYMSDNKFSVVADYPKLAFVEKYHTLTFEGKKDEERGQDMLEMSAKQVEERPKFDLDKWILHAKAQATAIITRKSIESQVEAGVDRALNWQIRRYVNSYTEDGSLNPSSSSRWASHSLKAQHAIELAKDPNFTRGHLKSEQHCKHLEEGQGFTVSHTEDTVTIPLGRPVTMFSGEMVNAPSHYLGFNVGHVTAHYDEDKGILQLFYQGYSNSRQYSDVKYPGPDGFAGLYVGPVSEGSDYVVDPLKDGRGDFSLRTEPPRDLFQFPDSKWNLSWLLRSSDVPDVSIWRRPLSERCTAETVNADFWKNIDIMKGSESIYDSIVQNLDTLNGVVEGMPCATSWMRADYGEGSHNFDANEIGVWAHSLGEIVDEYTNEMTLAPWWDEWECFYQGKDEKLCY